MQPMGRKYYKNKDSKHYIRIDGKYHAWWSDVCEPNKKKERQQAKLDIK